MSEGQQGQNTLGLVGSVLAGVAGVAVTLYALGALTIGISMHAAYADSWAEAWHLTALIPRTTLGVYGFTSLIWPASVNAVLSVAFVLLAIPLHRKLLSSFADQRLLVKQLVAALPLVLLGMAGALILFFLASIATSLALNAVFLNGSVWLYVLLTTVGGVIGGYIIREYGLKYENPSHIIPKLEWVHHPKALFVGFLVVYFCSYGGALFLANVSPPPLPYVTLVQYVPKAGEDEGRDYTAVELENAWRKDQPAPEGGCFEETKGWLVAQSSGYWYLFVNNSDGYGNEAMGYDHYELLVLPESDEQFLV